MTQPFVAVPPDAVLLLREARLSRNLTQKQLGRLSGVGDKTISSWETGERVEAIKLHQLLAILRVLNLTPQQFFAGDIYPTGSALRMSRDREFYAREFERLVNAAAADGVSRGDIADAFLDAHYSRQRTGTRRDLAGESIIGRAIRGDL